LPFFNFFLNHSFFFNASSSHLQTWVTRVWSHYKGIFSPYYLRLSFKSVGYRVWYRNRTLLLKLGFTHRYLAYIPPSVKFKVRKYKILLYSVSKSSLKESAFFLRSLRFPDPYNGKGIRFKGDRVSVKQRAKDPKKR
jgi:large subunit ribosomal protein L6